MKIIFIKWTSLHKKSKIVQILGWLHFYVPKRKKAYNGNKAYIHAFNAFNIYIMAILIWSYRTRNQKRRISHAEGRNIFLIEKIPI